MQLSLVQVIRTELFKIFRKGRSYIGFGAIAFIIIVIQIALYVDGESFLELSTQNLKDSFTFQGNLLNGYLSVFIILSSLWVHIPFLIALVAGDLISGEATSGTLRLILTRPVSRTKIVLGKFTAMLIYVLAIVAFMAALSIGTGLLIFGKGDLFVMKDMVYIFESTDVMWRIVSAFVFSFFSMSTVAALAFMLSALVDSSLGPIIMTMSIIIVFMIVSSIDLSIFRAVKPFMFTTYMGAWREFFGDPVDWNKIRLSLFALSAHTLIFVGFTNWYFGKKDILT